MEDLPLQMNMVVPAFMISFLIAFALIPMIIAYSKKKNLLDRPGGRKMHTGNIPALGGIAIFTGFASSMLMWSTIEQLLELRYIYAGIVVILFLGIRDDISPISPLLKIVWQVSASLMAMYFGGIYFTSLHGLLGIGEVPIWIGYPVTIFTFIVIINAFNLIDGINGLAGTTAVIVLFSFGIWFYFAQQYAYVILTATLAGGILAFLKYNYTPAQIFMGDTGALTIGFIMAVISVKALETNADLASDHIARMSCPVTAALVVMLYPMVDTLRVFSLRLSQGRSPFSPDRNHIHHLLIRTGKSHEGSVFIIAIINILLIIFVYLVLRPFDDWIALPIVLLICVSMISWLKHRVKQYKVRQKKVLNTESSHQKHK